MLHTLTITRLLTAIIITGSFLLLTNCDFPADPPLRTPDTEPPAVVPTDSTGVLLPLRNDVRWVYVFELPRHVSLPKAVTPRLLEIEELQFSYVPYIAISHAPMMRQPAFPLLLRNDSLGLSFYKPVHVEDTNRLSVRPTYMYTLPYPARSGRMYEMGRNKDYTVRITHRDTLITMVNHPVSLPCHRYEVWRQRQLETVFYIVPGLCILRVERDNLIFHTIGWSL
ncbi:MAG: hypothetical protein KFH87_04460 [Bacteroidetes bacterium]|nr:hypothetical protein [Bacteroidota bacterium]